VACEGQDSLTSDLIESPASEDGARRAEVLREYGLGASLMSAASTRHTNESLVDCDLTPTRLEDLD
jgi:hypothetical protein